MFSFVDISGDLCSKDSERYVVAAAATVQREKISSITNRIHRCAARNNRRALMIIDNQARTIDRWTAYAFNNFLFRSGKGVGLGNIIEMPLFADSEMTQGIQVADIAASILRHYHDRALHTREPSSRFEEKVGEYCAVITRHSPTYNTRARPLYVAPENFVEKNFTKH